MPVIAGTFHGPKKNAVKRTVWIVFVQAEKNHRYVYISWSDCSTFNNQLTVYSMNEYTGMIDNEVAVG